MKKEDAIRRFHIAQLACVGANSLIRRVQFNSEQETRISQMLVIVGADLIDDSVIVEWGGDGSLQDYINIEGFSVEMIEEVCEAMEGIALELGDKI